MMKLIILILALLPLTSFALDVDEKLTVRILKTSETHKTIMANRGTEDGLVEGDHAKFIVTAGIVARAICVKVSPTRSVWSIYRLVNADFIINDSVMTLKITPPVKVTKDESQTLVQEDTPTRPSGDPKTMGIPLAEGAQDMSLEESLNQTDLKAMEESNVPTTIVEKNREVFGMINISGLTASSKSDVGNNTYNSSQSFYNIGIGGEYYPQNEREWYSRWSLLGSVSLMRENSQAYNGASVTNEMTEFSVGTNLHPWTKPSVTSEFIPFLHADLHVGTVKSTYKSGTEFGNADVTKTANGGTNGWALGFGYKYYTPWGFGVRALFDYYLRNEKYKQDAASNIYTRAVGGPRLMLGISYRF